MKKKAVFSLMATLLFMVGSSLAGNPVKNFDELMKSLNEGKSMRMIVHYADCQLISDNEIQERVPNAIGGMDIDVYEYFAEGAVRNKVAFVVFSTSKLIQNPIGDGYVYNYVKVKVSADNKVRITARYLNPITFEEEMDENFFSTINDGEEGSVYFYEQD